MYYYDPEDLERMKAPVRNIKAKVELYNGSTLADTFTHDGKLISFKIERVAESGKFFGFGICQRAEVEILDPDREIDYITTDFTFDIYIDEWYCAAPTFYVTQCRRDENTNALTIYGYDILYKKGSIRYFSDLPLYPPYTIDDVAITCFESLGVNDCIYSNIDDESVFYIEYENGANFEGTETLREVLDDIAEATQTIYYIDFYNNLIFKRLNESAEADLTITKDDYFTLECRDGRRLATICHATELGDNVSASTSATGSTQYVRENGFWELREDIDKLVEDAVAAVGGLTIRQFACEWRGNPFLDIGDKIALTTKENNVVYSYVLDDVLTYDGTLSQVTQWSYQEEEETESNPSSLGEVLKQTYAKVDKANKQVEIVASEVEGYESRIAILELDTTSINASVSNLEKTTTERLADTNTDIAFLSSRVDAAITAEDVEIKISSALSDGVSKVETETGFTFNNDGLQVSKSGSEMLTSITEDGMTVSKNGSVLLTANNEGVKAIDLHAETFLIIGTNSRFENYGSNRTGCFWIGGK